jgi:hypothetical protein
MADYYSKKKVEKRKQELAIEELDKKIKYIYFQSTTNKEGKRETLDRIQYLSGRVEEKQTWDA